MGVGYNWRAADWRAWLRTREVAAPELQKCLEVAAIAAALAAAAGLCWALAAPTAPRATPGAPAIFDNSPAAFDGFDPFFRLKRATGPTDIVTSLNLTLHGVRADRVSGRGAAIIGLPDGTQNSYAVGDEIVPGAVLAGVGFDNVTIRRDGTNETLYLDQSTVAPIIQAGGPAPIEDPFAAVRSPGGRGIAPLIADVSAEPRMRGGRIDGYLLKPGSIGSSFAAAGFRSGDVLLTIDGNRVGEGVGLERLAGKGPVKVEIERDGHVVALTVGGAQ